MLSVCLQSTATIAAQMPVPFTSFVGITRVCFYNFYWRTISILYIFVFRHITSTFANTYIVAPTILFAIRIGTAATRGAVVLLPALLPMLPSMLELPFHLFDFLIGIFCFLLEASKCAPFLLPVKGALLLPLPKLNVLVVPSPLYFLQSRVGCVFQAFGEVVKYFLHRVQPPPLRLQRLRRAWHCLLLQGIRPRAFHYP
jgi:hypothetical protein